jgi:1-acyl-sn-glycerol-3-phosphate acyltransferase
LLEKVRYAHQIQQSRPRARAPARIVGVPEPGERDPPLGPDPGAALTPAGAEELRRHLPGLEPDRQISDWGRSERVEALVDRTLYDFLYHYWFRVSVEGVENVPSSGGALLVANHAGAVPPDAAMIAKAIREEHPQPRPLHFLSASRLVDLPALGMLVTKVGGVADHPANLHRLLFDEGELVLVFPEGRDGPAKPVNQRYRLRSFEHGGLVASAMRAGVPIVPVAVMGSEEAVPVLARLSFLRRLTRLPRVPVAPVLPLPAKFTIRFLEPIHTASLAAAAWRHEAQVRTLTNDIRALIQENLLELVSHRRSVWLG